VSKILIIKCNYKSKHGEIDAEVQNLVVERRRRGKEKAGIRIVNMEFAGKLRD